MGMIPAFFYLYLDLDEKLREILNLKVLKTITDYAEYHKKRKNLSYHIDRMIFRNLKVKNGEIYVLDTFIVPVDLNKRRSGNKIVQGTFDAEFVFDPLKGTTAGYIVAVLINLSNKGHFSGVVCFWFLSFSRHFSISLGHSKEGNRIFY